MPTDRASLSVRSRPAWATRPTEAEIGYGGTLFARASTFVRARGHTSTRAWLTDLGGLTALVRLAAFLPTLEVRLTDAGPGGQLRTALAGRTLGVPRNRLCAAVFDVPTTVADRPSGKRNQALRTALTAATKAGVRVRRVTDPAERRRIALTAARQVPRLASWSRTAPQQRDLAWWVAEDAAGALMGVATVVVDAEWASLVTLVGIPGAGNESHARYVLHHAVVQSLSRAGVGQLTVLDHSPLLLDAGPQHLQRVLGYRVARLRRPTRTSRRPAVLTDPVPPIVVSLPTVSAVRAGG